MAASTETKPVFTITRTFDAPRELVWKAWSDAARLAQWWGPKGCTIQIKSLDFKPDGIFHYAMHWANGAPTMWGRFTYGAINAPEKLEFINSFSNEAGDIVRSPFSPTWPLQVMNVVTFTEQDGKTTLHLEGTPLTDHPDELMTFRMFFASMQQGFGGTFEQLDAYLAQNS